MRLDFSPFAVAVAVGLATTVAADRLMAQQMCNIFAGCTHYGGRFITNNGVAHDVDVSGGCRGTSVPNMVEFCISWNVPRGHFRFSHEQNKRCLIYSRIEHEDCGLNTCAWVYFEEGPCTW